MSETTRVQTIPAGRAALSKVPEITVWFWVIKILCTTVGESFADWINITLGVGLNATALIFTVILVVVLGLQLRLNRYVPLMYWSTVVVLSVAGTLYTDILTDSRGVPLAVSTSLFAAALAVVFGLWFARERTLSIHSIVSGPRELFYWLAVLVTFALGTAAGDWTLDLTGWGPGISVLLPAGLIVSIVLGWKLGANAVLAFWLAYILTRPLGANLGDWFVSPTSDHGLGLGTAVTSVIFLVAILATVLYLARTRADVIDGHNVARSQTTAAVSLGRERIMLGYFAVIAASTVALLIWAAAQPHSSAASEGDSTTPAADSAPLAPGQATAKFPPADVASIKAIVVGTLAKVQSSNQADALAGAKDLETTWDDDQATLEPLDETGWTVLDGRIDKVLKAVRAGNPDRTTESQILTALLTELD